jgi:hypothetical protein
MKGRRVPPRQQPELPPADECDRLYFEQHPNATEYIRPYESGEFPIEFFSPPGHCVLMRVMQIAPGIRSPKPFLSKIGVAA